MKVCKPKCIYRNFYIWFDYLCFYICFKLNIQNYTPKKIQLLTAMNEFIFIF